MQRHLLHIIVLLLVVTAVSCTRTSRHPQLVVADSLLLSQPDSALVLLRGMHFTSESDRMYHTLLLADACNKCYDTLPPDSMLREVADFYDSHGTPNEQVRAHYLLGCAYRDLGEAPQALDCYHDAIDRADTLANGCNYRLLMSVYGQMAELFYKQNLPEDDVEANSKYSYYALCAGDSLNYIRGIELMSKAYDLLGDTIRMSETIRNTHSLYKSSGFPHLAVSGNATLAYVSVMRGDLDEAHSLLTEFEQQSGLFDSEGNITKDRCEYYYIKGVYFDRRNQMDSAEHYMRKLLESGDEVDAYRGLLNIYKRKKETDSIVKFVQCLENAIDTLDNIKRTEAIHQMASLYNYHRFQQIANRESKAAEKAKMRSATYLSIFILILLIGLFVYVQYKKKKEDEIRRLNEDYGLALLEYNKKSVELESLKLTNNDLNKEKQQEISLLKDKIRQYQKKLRMNNANLQLSELKESTIVRLFKEKSKGSLTVSRPTDAEWNRLIRHFSRSVPSVYSSLGRDVILSSNELRICILFFLGFKTADMTILLGNTAQSVTNIKTKANQKLFGESTATTFEKNLMKTIGMV